MLLYNQIFKNLPSSLFLFQMVDAGLWFHEFNKSGKRWVDGFSKGDQDAFLKN